MEKSNQQDRFYHFRGKFPFFIYEGYDFSYSEHGLDIRYDFNLAGKYRFHPTLFIPHKDFFLPAETILRLIPNLVFHLGLIELISYWKAACPPEVIIKPHQLSDEQVNWWKKIWFNGLSEFFYLNGIAVSRDDFLHVRSGSEALPAPVGFDFSSDIIVPVGGGKDSIVTLEILRNHQRITPMIVNPRGASVHSIFMAGYAHAGMIGIHRTIDPQLLALNGMGFMNGHTPFSAVLAFLSVLSSVITGKKFIALSNESSANEATISGTDINHQYSKTVGFEKDFREYQSTYLSPATEYFSFLRPLNEIQIAGIFTHHPVYFPVFKSCNAGSKTDSWCGLCPKCLFTAILLAPFLPPESLRAIFHKDILDDMTLRPLFDQLIGISPEKPFECVGTVAEVNAALRETLLQYREGPYPALLEYYQTLPGWLDRFPVTLQTFMHGWDTQHFLPLQFEKQLKMHLYG